jgi:hypothetical protein
MVRLQPQLKQEAEMWRDLDAFGAISIEKLKVPTILSLAAEVNLGGLTDSCTVQSAACGTLEKGRFLATWRRGWIEVKMG